MRIHLLGAITPVCRCFSVVTIPYRDRFASIMLKLNISTMQQCNNVLLEILQLDKTLFTSSRSLDTNNYESNGLCWSCAIGMSISGKCLSAGMFPSTISDVYRKQQTRKNEENYQYVHDKD